MIDALVIGASGGIGQAMVAEMRARGGNVTTVSRSEDGLDVTDAASVDRVLGALEGPFQTVFVATGILAPDGAAPEKQLSAIDAHTMADVFAVNTMGTANILRHLPRLLPKKGRSVAAILTARVGSITDNKIGGWHSYRASKAAANMLIRGAAIELSRTHRDALVTAMHPGTVATPFTADYAAKNKTVPAQDTAKMLCDVMERLEATGTFVDYSGAEIPW
ncbi:C factor, cell signaling protein [Jannaschia sp. EhC01]|uniref:SDR family NAD(P)-dependent oxidoreductase n=1 Tax=Gymnodinialimonas phycosphaerae TaxID=2841589 RepID=A0A975TR30_9RHOB|nr:SDR family NAD(P)-dependent oxidoreductase [Gymnodinialimonas phycosphaerae]MBY4893423.1 SDR family NAD(P)-dependent oxidoreductase [Gymnodinialimonas phycosphaerae]OAN76222.1 C factor, cell signaling protein [Jannaschia sp. EhC01]